jgi:hypothetical protein
MSQHLTISPSEAVRRPERTKSDSFRTLHRRGEKALLAIGFPRVYISGPRTSTPWSRGKKQISVTACCAQSISRVGCCSLIR